MTIFDAIYTIKADTSFLVLPTNHSLILLVYISLTTRIDSSWYTEYCKRVDQFLNSFSFIIVVASNLIVSYAQLINPSLPSPNLVCILLTFRLRHIPADEDEEEG